MKYLITGGCGFLGSNIASKVLEQGDELIKCAWVHTHNRNTTIIANNIAASRRNPNVGNNGHKK